MELIRAAESVYMDPTVDAQMFPIELGRKIRSKFIKDNARPNDA